MRIDRVLAAAVLAVCATPACVTIAQAKNENYHAQVYRTSYGIPHIKAQDWGSLGYGYGYAFAQDNVCVLARDVVTANGTQSKYFGAGTGKRTRGTRQSSPVRATSRP